MVMANESVMTPAEGIESRIHFIRGQRVMLDSDLAAIYGVTTAALNQALKRNIQKFPSDFAYQLAFEEFTNLISQIVTSSSERKAHGALQNFTETIIHA
jgi:hypothetical protein